MNIREKARRLEQLKHLRREVDLLSQRIAELELAAQGGAEGITGLPRCPGRRKRTAARAAQLNLLRERLEAHRACCMELLGALYAFIDGVDDSLIRQILIYRYIDGETWQSIAGHIDEKDEQYPRRLHNRFLAQAEPPELGKVGEMTKKKRCNGDAERPGRVPLSAPGGEERRENHV